MVQALEPATRRAPGRVPPHNLEAEESLLGAMLLSRDAISAATEARVDASAFYKPAHGHVYEAVMSLYGQGEPVDPVTVADELRRADLLDALGGRQTLLRLQAGTPASANAAHYAKIVGELALLRRLIAVAGDIAEMGYDDSAEVAETLDHAEALVFEVAEQRVSESMVKVTTALQDTLDQLEALYGSEGDITGVQTGYTDLDHLLLGLQPSNLIVVASRPGMGKCVAWDTLVVDAATGDLRTAAEMHRRGRLGVPGRVVALGDDWKLAAATPSDFIDDGVRPVYRVETRSGRIIRTTAAHPFLTPTGWRQLADIAVKTRVAVPRTIPVFGSEAMPEAEIVLLAFLIGDGCLRSTSPSMTTASPEIQTELAERCAELGVSVRANGKYAYRLVTQRGATNPVIDMCRRHGLWGKTSHDKRIPEAIFRLSRPHLALFLNRLFATDGSAWVDKNGFTQIEYTSVSEPLARGVQHLLLRFGVLSRLKLRNVAYQGTRRPAWTVAVTAHESLLSFCDEIGILGRERAIERVRRTVSNRLANPNLDTLPVETWQRIVEAKGDRSWASVSAAAGRPRSHNWHVGTRAPGRGIVGELSRLLASPDLEKIASSDIYWDEVVSIRADGHEQVYDLTVPELHNFVAGDVIVHNSSFALGAAANVAMTARRPVMFFSMEMGVLELTKRLLAAEARVDARRLQTGDIPEAEWGRLSHAVGRLAETPLYIDDNPHCTVMEMRAKARRAKARHGDLGLIVVDYLQLMTPSTTRRMENRQVEVAEISRGLKILARELDCPVMALSQLNRQLEYRQDKRPMLADLRESGCMPATTRLARADTGTEVTLGELVLSQEQPLVWSLDEHWRLVPRRLTRAFPSGIKSVFRLRLRSGYEVDATANHPFRTVDGWRSLSQLNVGDALAVPRRVPAPSPFSGGWDDDELILLAHLLGDGHMGRSSVKYATADPANKAAVEGAAQRLFGIAVSGKKVGRTWQLRLPSPYRLTHGRFHPVRGWLEPLGLWGARSHDKFVPEEVFRHTDAQIALFLRHLWATDGSITISRNARGQLVNIYYATTSRRLADDVRRLLLRLDIRSRVSRARKAGYRDSWHVRIAGRDDRAEFLTGVGCHGQRGMCIPDALEILASIKPNPNVDLVPWAVAGRVKTSARRVGVTHRELAAALDERYCGSYLLGSSRKPRRFSRHRLRIIGETTRDPKLVELATSDVFWDEIAEIVPLGEMPTFDATVEETHNFVANGVIAHNSLEQDADVVVFLYRDEVYNPESDQRGSAEIIVSKHRNGPTGLTRLAFLDHFVKFANMARE